MLLLTVALKSIKCSLYTTHWLLSLHIVVVVVFVEMVTVTVVKLVHV